MTSIVSLVSKPGAEDGIHVDLAGLEAPMKETLRRSSVFLGYAVRVSDGPPLATVALGAVIELSVGIPGLIPAAERKGYQKEFRSWAVGQGLIELDQGYQRFLAAASDSRGDIDAFVRERRLLTAYKTRLANTWTTHEVFFSDARLKSLHHDEDSSFLRSLGNARNCLAHDSGIVQHRRLTEGATMPVRWRGRDTFQTQPDGSQRLLCRDRPFKVKARDVGLTLSVQEVIREKTYLEGQRIDFSPTDLSEVIFFYQSLAMQVGAEMHRLTAEAGEVLNSA